MKDKLVKTGHKKNYYRLRYLLRSCIFVVSLLFISSAPIAITYTVYAVNGKEETSQTDSTSESSSSEEDSSIITSEE